MVSWTKTSKHIPLPVSSGLRSSWSGSGSGKTGTEQGGRSGNLCGVTGAGPGGSGDVPLPGCAVGWDIPSGKCRLCYSHRKSGNTGPKRPSETFLGSAGDNSHPQGADGAGIGESGIRGSGKGRDPPGKGNSGCSGTGGRRTGIQGDTGGWQEQPGWAVRDGNPGWC